ncbi:phospholipid/cholesterol/gamma-HCH transport system substrate-binding protein [Amycolatopsis arida]|uniref:Phospholipid/cholesterol/gamma-HCH transport system substrate-binding protein n=1 Tax=Amycolatopsis arida TaxID=587909 RepID=A0A1I6A4A6_9PSEU|nr:MCE family protein [Amycolatopsis arida]TDX88626.1 phospholipid/cholesterol/gamma-HCH transport system substrate-binding protein [Amycolatopsis arida]SFQ63492.1 phospholipid/cholesterol/gamma-HCH transport system substrate-binding protein [Amycolatopsis arida]
MRGLLGPLVKLTIFIVVTTLFTAVLGISIANLNLSDTKTYKARFTDATLLLPNDDVRIAGVRVGQVEEIRIVDRRFAEVEFAVDANRRLPAGVTATIKFRNLVGQRYVALEQGDGDPNRLLEPGDTIPLERTKPALDLTELFNGFKPLFTALTPDDVNTLSYQIIQVLQGEGGTVESLLAHTASLTTKIAEKDRVIGEVIDNLNGVLDTVNARTPQLNDLIIRMQQLVSGLAQDREPIGDAIESLGGLASTTAGLLTEAREPLREDIDALGQVAQNLNDHEQVVEHFIQFLPEKVTRMSRTADYGSWFNFYLCSASGSIQIPGLMSKPFDLPIAPVTRERCGA